MKATEINYRTLGYRMCIALAIFICMGTTARSQNHPPYPVVGDTIENHVFYDMVNFPEGKRQVKDFRGKWLLLDVWGYSCGSCINSFPKMNKLYEHFGDKIEIVMVGMTKSRGGGTKPVATIEKITKDLYSRLWKQHSLTLPAAFDSLFYEKFYVSALPQILLIDPQGVLRVKTVSVDSISIAGLLKGEQVSFESSYSFLEPKFSKNRILDIPLLTLGKPANGGRDTDYIYRSLLTIGSKNTTYKRVDLYHEKLNGSNHRLDSTGTVEVLNSDLDALYRIAYLGKNFWNPEDSFAYQSFWPVVVWEPNGKPLAPSKSSISYSFSLKVPPNKANRKDIMMAMQSELKNFFNHHVTIETRPMPVYFLKVANKPVASSFLHQTTKWNRGSTTLSGLVCWDRPFKDFYQMLASSLHLEKPLIDLTGLNEIVRVNLKADFLDRQKVFEALIQGGLEIVEGYRDMAVVVVKR